MRFSRSLAVSPSVRCAMAELLTIWATKGSVASVLTRLGLIAPCAKRTPQTADLRGFFSGIHVQ
jgi:hypothetical protein